MASDGGVHRLHQSDHARNGIECQSAHAAQMGTGHFRTGAHTPFRRTSAGLSLIYFAVRAVMASLPNASGSRAPSSHEMPWNVFCNPALVICNPSFRDFLCSEARHHRGGTSRHDNLNTIGRVFLGNDPVGSASMRMFFCHPPNMVKESGKCTLFRAAKCSNPPPTPLPNSGDELL